MSSNFLFACLVSVQLTYAANLTPETLAAFDRYIQLTEAHMNQTLDPAHLLRVASKPGVRAALQNGEFHIESASTLDQGKEIKVPDGMIQDWLGAMFIPNATIAQVKAVLQDYDNYKNFYKPEVIESRVISHKDDEYDIFLRLYKKQILTVVLNTNYHVRYAMPDSRRMTLVSHSTRVAEVKNPKQPDQGEAPIGHDTGFLWRLNAYWRFEEGDGGVYAECEAISLSRDVPAIVGWMIKGFVQKFPRESMQNTLRGTKAAVIAAAAPANPSKK